MRDQEGSATPQLLAVLVLLAAGLAGLISILDADLGYARRSEDRARERDLLLRFASSVSEQLAKDPSPGSDSPTDPFWTSLKVPEGLKVTVRDLSSSINPNFARKALFEKTGLGSLFASGRDAAGLQQFREDNGLSTSLEHYREFFGADAREYLSAYGWANVNITDEFSLRALVRSLSGSEERAEIFHAKIQRLLEERKLVGEADFPSVFGLDAELVFPVINAAPSYNVHFLDSYILGELLTYPEYGIEDPIRKTAALVSLRQEKELVPSDISAILGVNADHILLQYLGTRTWFWEIVISSPKERLRFVIARIPRAGLETEDSPPRFVEIERSFGS